MMAVAGCGGQQGFVVKPVPLDQTLKETVILREPGMFVSAKIAVVNVDGLLLNDRRQSMFRADENIVSLFVEQIDRAQGDSDVKALVVRINSPGGSVTASDIMYQRVKRFRQARPGVPTIAVIEDLGTSGGYYIASACQTIWAHPTSITGSIGVIVQTVSFAGTMEKLGITARAITSGPLKDMISPLKPLDDRDAKVVQEMVNGFYERFVEVVAAGREGKLTPQQVRQLADGRVYTGKQALENRLVDCLGYMDDALAAAKTASGQSRVKVVMYDRPLGYRANAYSQGELTPQMNLVNITVPHLMDMNRPQFLYLWSGPRGQGL
jgi:protease-4